MKKPELHKDHRERMRSRFKKNGISGFEEHEILEVLLYSAIPRRNTNDIAHDLLREFGDIPGVLSADEMELCRVNGIGKSAASYLRLTGELFGEITGKLFENIPLDSPESAGIYAMLQMSFAPADSASVVYLNKEGIRIYERELYRGKRKMTDDIVDNIITEAKETDAAGILLMHNHKNEPGEPSPEDVLITEELRRKSGEADISSVVHVIVYDDGYVHI